MDKPLKSLTHAAVFCPVTPRSLRGYTAVVDQHLGLFYYCSLGGGGTARPDRLHPGLCHAFSSLSVRVSRMHFRQRSAACHVCTLYASKEKSANITAKPQARVMAEVASVFCPRCKLVKARSLASTDFLFPIYGIALHCIINGNVV